MPKATTADDLDDDVAADVVATAADVAGTTGDAGPPTGRQRLAALGAVVVAVLPFLVAGVRGALRGWQPTGDDAISAIRAWDLFSTNPPLLGTWSSASEYVGRQINHPGPLHFDLLAIPVRLLGHGPGTAVGTALINAVSVALVGWLVWRRMGREAAALAMGFCAVLAWSMGSEMLYEPWSQYAPLWPFTLFVVAAWCAVAGDAVALPVMVVAGSVALQTHLSYSVLVPGIAGFALAACAVRVLQRRRSDPDGWPTLRRRAVRWGLVVAATTLLTWSQPLVENFTSEGEGNLRALVGAADVESVTPGLRQGITLFGSTVALPPAWAPPSYGSPAFDLGGGGRPVLLCAAALVTLAGALGLLGWRAYRRGAQPVAAGCLTAMVALALGLASVLKAPARYGLTPNYFRWMWPLGMVVWLALTLGVADEVRARLARRTPRLGDVQPSTTVASRLRRAGGWALPGLVVAVVGGVAALPTVDNGSTSPPWASEGIRAIDDDVVAAVGDKGPVLVELNNHVAVHRVGPPIMSALQAAGHRFSVSNENLVRQLGTVRRFDPGDAEWRLTVKGGESAGAGPGEELVAEWRDLSPDELDELERLSDEVADVIADHGVAMTDDADDVAAAFGVPHVYDEMKALADDPAAAARNPRLRHLWSGPLIDYVGHALLDPDVFPAELMDRWAELMERADYVVKVYLSPITPPA